MERYEARDVETGRKVVECLSMRKWTGETKRALDELAAAQKNLEAAAAVASEALSSCEDIRHQVKRAMDVLDEKVISLALAMPGKGLGSLNRPFGVFSPLTPTKMLKLGAEKKMKEVQRLEKNLRRGPESDAVKFEAKAVSLAAAEAMRQMEALRQPQQAFDMARAEREAAHRTWREAFAELRNWARAALHDEPMTYRELFLSPRPARKRHSAAPVVEPEPQRAA